MIPNGVKPDDVRLVVTYPCQACHGLGHIIEGSPCPMCAGQGHKKEDVGLRELLKWMHVEFWEWTGRE